MSDELIFKIWISLSRIAIAAIGLYLALAPTRTLKKFQGDYFKVRNVFGSNLPADLYDRPVWPSRLLGLVLVLGVAAFQVFN